MGSTALWTPGATRLVARSSRGAHQTRERLGYWWYAVGLLAAPVTGPILCYTARLQARVAGFPSAAKALADVRDIARPSDGDVLEQVTTVLGQDPRLEHTVHRLAWRVAGHEGTARSELEAL
ncbi:hypothetical protein [Luteimicrobium subarcticum]|uniref:Uncharacterized protein n=1 Tax=Luteimicrobium subarcticum TaxID=620910 RepID=A0A2M8WVM5_9MICO|nr:hypothetical protein [Luteimicrobium subarcticum]PJI94972.1 hypothetical protein CLV34_0824 [Luteimicrobium subarcticum]